MTIVAVGLHIYHLTQSTLAVSLVALFALLPMIIAGLYGGMLADTFDRRKLAMAAAILAWSSVAMIAALSWIGLDRLWPLYLLTTINSVATTVIVATRAAIVPRLLPNELLPAASALGGIGQGVMVTVGPTLAGALVTWSSFAVTYTVDVVLFCAAFIGIFTLPPIVPEEHADGRGLRSILSGLQFLRTAPNLRTSFLSDIVAMSFGWPRVIYPATGALVIGGGAMTVGWLTAAFAIGVLVSSVFSGRVGQVRRQGVAVGRAIRVYGFFIFAFGVVLAVTSLGDFGPVSAEFEDVRWPSLIAALICLVGAGGADNLSSIFRTSILQAASPDVMRGRMQGVNTVVVTGGPRIGDLYVGAVATTGLLWLPQVLGGILIMGLLTLLLARQRSFRDYDALNPIA